MPFALPPLPQILNIGVIYFVCFVIICLTNEDQEALETIWKLWFQQEVKIWGLGGSNIVQLSLISAGNWFQETSRTPNSMEAQVSYIKWQRTGNFLAVQWLRLSSPAGEHWSDPLAGELRSFMLCGVAKENINKYGSKYGSIQQIQFALCIYRCKLQMRNLQIWKADCNYDECIIRLWASQTPCFLATSQFP